MTRVKMWKFAVLISLGLAACLVPALDAFDQEKTRDCNTEHPCLSGFACVESHCQPEEGTACQPGSTAACGLEIGECQRGVRSCGDEGTYGPCMGASLPSTEVCNGKDDDCNGSTDEQLSCGDGGDPCAACATAGRTCVDGTCGSCLEGYFAEGTQCLPKRALGESCAENTHCGSGFCADGSCCDQACTGPCERCDVTRGTCSPAEDGNAGEPVCTPYLCDGAGRVCPTQCAKNEDCAAGVLCVNNRCGDKLPLGAACTVSGQCSSGHCVDGNCCGDAACDNPSGPCYQTAGTCSNGACSYTPKPAGTSCDDSNPGTTNDVCNDSGVCVGTVPVCNGPPNTQCYNSTGSWDGSKCVYTRKTAGSSCSDGNDCTVGDVCNASGTCGGSEMVCNTAPSQCHTSAGTCSGGKCQFPFKPSGAACDDDDPCTINDRCDGYGTCVVTAVTCEQSSSQCRQSIGTCNGGTCSFALKPTGSGCNDNNACTTGDACSSSGTCGGTPIICNDPPSQCHQANGTCNNGTCNYPLKPSGTSCNDGNTCTTGDVCNSSGACGGTPLVCNSPPQCNALPGVCESGVCVYGLAEEGKLCDDGNKCTKFDRCDAEGDCVGIDYCPP